MYTLEYLYSVGSKVVTSVGCEGNTMKQRYPNQPRVRIHCPGFENRKGRNKMLNVEIRQRGWGVDLSGEFNGEHVAHLSIPIRESGKKPLKEQQIFRGQKYDIVVDEEHDVITIIKQVWDDTGA